MIIDEPPLTIIECEKVKYALDNVFTLARREYIKAKDPKVIEMWGHVIRLCIDAGCKSSILRSNIIR